MWSKCNFTQIADGNRKHYIQFRKQLGSCFFKHSPIMWHHHSIPKCLLKKNKNIFPNKDLYMDIPKEKEFYAGVTTPTFVLWQVHSDCRGWTRVRKAIRTMTTLFKHLKGSYSQNNNQPKSTSLELAKIKFCLLWKKEFMQIWNLITVCEIRFEGSSEWWIY